MVDPEGIEPPPHGLQPCALPTELQVLVLATLVTSQVVPEQHDGDDLRCEFRHASGIDGAADEIRTRILLVGNEVLNQLSYYRMCSDGRPNSRATLAATPPVGAVSRWNG